MKKILIITTVILTLFAYSCDSSPPAVDGTDNPHTIVDPDNPGTTEPDNPGTTDPDNPGTTDPETPSTTIKITNGDGLHAPSDTVQLSCSPEIGGITWTSSNSDLIEVSSTGLVSQKKRTAATEIQDVTITAQVNGAEVDKITLSVGDYSYNESTNTYHIYSELGLNYWAESDNVLIANVTLERDIALTQVKDTNGSTWNSVGTGSASTGYAGTFDGKNHTISGLKVIRTDDSQRYGLFRVVTGTVKNLNLTEVYVKIFGGFAGGIAGKSYGTIEDCIVSGTLVEGRGAVGGVVGHAEGGSILSCKNECNVYSYGQDATVGGIVGNASNKCEIRDSHNYGVLTSEGDYEVRCGGIVGQLQTYSKVTSCSNSGNIEAKHTDKINHSTNTLSVGGIAGSVSSGSSVTKCSIGSNVITINASYYSSGLNKEAAVKDIAGEIISNVSTETVVKGNTGTAKITTTNLSDSSTSTSV